MDVLFFFFFQLFLNKLENLVDGGVSLLYRVESNSLQKKMLMVVTPNFYFIRPIINRMHSPGALLFFFFAKSTNFTLSIC